MIEQKTMEKKLNVLGLDVFQTAAVKRGYQNVKRMITQREKLEEKLEGVKRQIEELEEQIKDADTYTLKLTEKVIGFPLSSEKCMYFLSHPEEFEGVKQENETTNN